MQELRRATGGAAGDAFLAVVEIEEWRRDLREQVEEEPRCLGARPHAHPVQGTPCVQEDHQRVLLVGHGLRDLEVAVVDVLAMEAGKPWPASRVGAGRGEKHNNNNQSYI